MQPGPKRLFTLLDTPITAEPSALLTPLNLFGLGLWLAGADRFWSHRLRSGALLVLVYALADLTHYVGHILTSRLAGAPLTRVHLAAPLPRSVYPDIEVSPQQHRLRALGGPLGSGLACLLSLALRPVSPANSLWREGLTLLSWGNGLLALGSLFPLPLIDGGAILKWTLVEQGQAPAEAEQTVRRVNLSLAGSAMGVGVAMLWQRRWKAAGVAIASALPAIAAGLGKL